MATQDEDCVYVDEDKAADSLETTTGMALGDMLSNMADNEVFESTKEQLMREQHSSDMTIPSLKSSSPPIAPGILGTKSRIRTDSGGKDSIASDVSRSSCSSIVDGLLFEIYDRWNSGYRRSSYDDSDTTYMEYSSTSDTFTCRSDSVQLEQQSLQYQRRYLQSQDVDELRHVCSKLRQRVSQKSSRLIRLLKNRDRHSAKAKRNCEILTAILQASSLKRRIDSKIRFSIEPMPGEEAFGQWCDAMRAVARLPLGIPTEFRKKVWLALANHHIDNLKIDWEQTRRLAFNDRSNPDDNRLGLQIVKDLHRTGCSGFSGTDNVEDRAILKRVLLAYARWNKKVGYCQGFNVLAALILDVMDMREDDALKVMIYLVDHVLPESYFANNLRALSVDMAVFRDLLHLQLPKLSKRLDYLQAAARDDTTGANYEPPLTNVFTMQWFLTLFATCLPKSTALRVWDSVLLEGSEILLRTAVAIWGKLQKRIMVVQSADVFYTTMGTLTHEMLSCNIIDADDLIKKVYAMAPLPMPQLSELREKYTYNITPFTATMNTDQRPQHSAMFNDEDQIEDENYAENINCFGGMFPPQSSPSHRGIEDMDKMMSGSNFDISKASPGAYAAQPEIIGPLTSVYAERMSLDIVLLNQQYKKLKQRQNQTHIIIAAASALHYGGKGSKHKEMPKQQAVVAPIQSPMAVNHLFIGRQQVANGKKNKTVAQAPSIVPFYPSSNIVSQQTRMSSKNDLHLDLQKNPASANDAEMDTDNKQCSENSKAKFCSSLSVNSSTSGSSTLKSSVQSGSASNVSTIGLESDYAESDTESLSSDKAYMNDLIGWNEGEHDSQSTDGNVEFSNKKGSNDKCVNEEITEHEKEVECHEQESNIDLTNTKVEQLKIDIIVESPAICGGGKSSETCSSKHLPGYTDSRHCKKLSDDGTEQGIISGDDSNGNIQSNNVLTKTSQSKGNALSPKSKNKGHDPGGQVLLDGVLDPQKGTQIQIGTSAVSASNLGSPDTDPETHYVAALTYKSHKALQSQHSSVNMHQLSSQHCNSGYQSNQTTMSRSLPQQATKLFNPFPGQHVNSRRIKNGLKLGLYSAKNLPTLETDVAQSHIIGQSRIKSAKN